LATALKVIDEVLGQREHREFTLRLVSERLTVRELIEARVRTEVNAFNARPASVFQGLIQPNDTERTLNGFKLAKPRRLDPDAQCANALKAFQSGRFFLLVDDLQVESLDDDIVIGPGTAVSFVKLVPLVGG